MLYFLIKNAITTTKKIMVSLFVFSIINIPGFGQEILNLENAISIGLENNYGIKIAKNETKITRNNAKPGNAGMLPGITASSSYNKSITAAKVEVITGAELEENHAQTEMFDAGIILNWTLFDGLNMFYIYDRLKKLEEIGEMELEVVLENTTADIILNYMDIVQQQLLMNVLNDQVEISRFRLQIEKIKKHVGSGSELELLQAQVDLNEDESMLFNRKTALTNTKISLNELLSRDVNINFMVADTIVLGPQLELPALKQYFAEHNREIIIQQMNKDALKLELKGLQAERYPEIDLITSYNFLLNKTEASFIKYNRLLGPYFGLSANFNIFNGFDQQRKIQNTHISLMNTDLQIQQTQNRLKSFLVRLFNSYQNDFKLIDFERKNFDMAKRNMEIAIESFEVGMISPLQLREVQKNRISAGNRMIQAQYRAKVKEVELLLISGQLIK